MSFLVSVIVPVYGVEKYVAECVQSLMAICRDDVECIIVNDKTPDASRDLITKKLCDYAGPVTFTIVDHDTNLGLSEARNTGINHASGKWIFFLDGDDYLLTDGFITILDDISKYDEFQIIQSTFISDWRKCTVNYPSFSLDILSAQKYYLHGQLVPYAWGRFVRRDFILQNNLFFAKNILGREDIVWLLDILQQKAKFFFYALPTVYYRENGESILHSRAYSKKRFDGITYLLEHAVEVGHKMDNKAMSFLLLEHSLPNTFDQLTSSAIDESSSRRFSAILQTIDKQYSNQMSFSQKIIWWHIYTPLKRLLTFTWYRNKFFTFFINIKRI